MIDQINIEKISILIRNVFLCGIIDIDYALNKVKNCKEGANVKIVSWNCNGKFRKKFEHIKELDADIYI